MNSCKRDLAADSAAIGHEHRELRSEQGEGSLPENTFQEISTDLIFSSQLIVIVRMAARLAPPDVGTNFKTRRSTILRHRLREVTFQIILFPILHFGFFSSIDDKSIVKFWN